MPRIILFAVVFLFANVAAAQMETLSLSLKEAQQMAIDSSYAQRSARYDTEIRKKEVKEVLGTGLPQINGTAELQDMIQLPTQLIPAEFFGGEVGEFAEIKFGTKYNFAASITASQLIFDGTYLVGVRASKTVLELTRNQEKKSEMEIKLDVAEAYYNVLLTAENLKILNQSMETVQKTLSDTRALFQNGLVEEQDVEQIQLNKNQIQINIDRTEQFHDISKRMLNFVIGLDLDTDVHLTDDIDHLVLMSNDEKYLDLDPQLNTHPDYLIAKTNVEVQNLNVQRYKAAYYPSLGAFFNHQQTAQRDEFDFLESGKTWFPSTVIGLQLNVPIWSSLQRKARVQQAEIGFEKSRLQLQQMEESLKLNVKQSRSNYDNAMKTWTNQKESLKLAENIHRKTNIKYNEGVASSFELNVAQSQLLEQQSQYIQAAMNLLTAKQNLDKALNIY